MTADPFSRTRAELRLAERQLPALPPDRQSEGRQLIEDVRRVLRDAVMRHLRDSLQGMEAARYSEVHRG